MVDSVGTRTGHRILLMPVSADTTGSANGHRLAASGACVAERHATANRRMGTTSAGIHRRRDATGLRWPTVFARRWANSCSIDAAIAAISMDGITPLTSSAAGPGSALPWPPSVGSVATAARSPRVRPGGVRDHAHGSHTGSHTPGRAEKAGSGEGWLDRIDIGGPVGATPLTCASPATPAA
jgi:hypothetical protein